MKNMALKLFFLLSMILPLSPLRAQTLGTQEWSIILSDEISSSNSMIRLEADNSQVYVWRLGGYLEQKNFIILDSLMGNIKTFTYKNGPLYGFQVIPSLGPVFFYRDNLSSSHKNGWLEDLEGNILFEIPSASQPYYGFSGAVFIDYDKRELFFTALNTKSNQCVDLWGDGREVLRGTSTFCGEDRISRTSGTNVLKTYEGPLYFGPNCAKPFVAEVWSMPGTQRPQFETIFAECGVYGGLARTKYYHIVGSFNQEMGPHLLVFNKDERRDWQADVVRNPNPVAILPLKRLKMISGNGVKFSNVDQAYNRIQDLVITGNDLYVLFGQGVAKYKMDSDW